MRVTKIKYENKPLVGVSSMSPRKQKTNINCLNESIEYFKAIIDDSRIGLVLINRVTYRINHCNSTFIKQTGRSLKQLRKMKIWEIFPPDQAQIAKNKFLRITCQKGMRTATQDILKPNGEVITCELDSKHCIARRQRIR